LPVCSSTLIVPATARGGRQQPGGQQQNADQRKKSAEEEKAYKDALRRIPNQKAADPWSKVR